MWQLYQRVRYYFRLRRRLKESRERYQPLRPNG
jgi:hypothetical protein